MATVTDTLRALDVRVGPVEMRLPSEPALSRVLRLAASGVAALAHRSVNEIEDIKIAVSEVFIALIEHGDGHQIAMQMSAEPDGFFIVGSTLVAFFDVSHPDLQLCRTVLADVCVDHSIEVNGGYTEIRALVRRDEIA